MLPRDMNQSVYELEWTKKVIHFSQLDRSVCLRFVWERWNIIFSCSFRLINGRLFNLRRYLQANVNDGITYGIMTILDFGVKSVKDLMLDVTLERANAGKNIVNEQNS